MNHLKKAGQTKKLIPHELKVKCLVDRISICERRTKIRFRNGFWITQNSKRSCNKTKSRFTDDRKAGGVTIVYYKLLLLMRLKQTIYLKRGELNKKKTTQAWTESFNASNKLALSNYHSFRYFWNSL